MSDMAAYWKSKYDSLASRVASLADQAEMERNRDIIEDECWSASDTFFISNHMEVVDNEEYAKENWGPGKYFKVKRVKR